MSWWWAWKLGDCCIWAPFGCWSHPAEELHLNPLETLLCLLHQTGKRMNAWIVPVKAPSHTLWRRQGLGERDKEVKTAAGWVTGPEV